MGYRPFTHVRIEREIEVPDFGQITVVTETTYFGKHFGYRRVHTTRQSCQSGEPHLVISKTSAYDAGEKMKRIVEACDFCTPKVQKKSVPEPLIDISDIDFTNLPIAAQTDANQATA